MPKTLALQNNFTGGLKTEFTGLNFPENACTAMDNTVVSIVGDVLRRNGINFEDNFAYQNIFVEGQAVSSFRWRNAGGNGLTEMLVLQIGPTLYFFESSNSTLSAPLSTTLLSTTVTVSDYLASGSTNSVNAVECQYASGNGYLFVYHPYCDPFYCSYAPGTQTITSAVIPVQIRDFAGIPDGLGVGGNIQGVTTRPSTLSTEHEYNLLNQGWVSSAGWSFNYAFPEGTNLATTQISFTVPFGDTHGGQYYMNSLATFSVPSGLSATVGQAIIMSGTFSGERWGGSNYIAAETGVSGQGIVNSYSGTSLVIAVSNGPATDPSQQWLFGTTGVLAVSLYIQPTANQGQIQTWFSQVGNYPSDSDVWWSYLNSSDQFAPASTLGSVSITFTPAPNGHYIMPAFNQNRSTLSGISGITNISTLQRPSTGAWFQGRVWYAGVNDSQSATGDAPFYTWAENIYFSQIITDSSQFGYCFQNNDPTSMTLFDLEPDDGGVIQIQGCGAIYKLFPVQNGLLVFASEGVWFITGSTGIGFTATDYTITKISSVQSISSYSFIDVLGYPVFWNEEGIYLVEPNQQGGLSVNPITVGTILSLYNTIPLDSKKFARGSYNPIDYVIEWVYRSTEETGIGNRYQYDSALCLNTYNKAFYPYTIASNNNCYVCGLQYMNYPTAYSSGSTQLNPTMKYLTFLTTGAFTFAEENDETNWVDWFSFDSTGVNYTASFTVGYSLAGKAIMKWQPTYVHMYSRNAVPTQYSIQGIWDYAVNPTSGRYSTLQNTSNFNPYYGMLIRRHKIRGHGRVLQINIESINGQPFDIMGWSVINDVDGGV